MPLRMAQWLMLATGGLAAFVVVLIFWALLESIDMRCTVRSGRYSAGCPQNSCFCTDCDPCNLYLAERTSWEWHRFGCSLLGLRLNRCWIAFFVNIGWLGATTRLGWLALRALGQDRGQLMLVVMASCLNATSAISLPTACLSRSTKLMLVSLKYNICNTCLLASSISVVLRLVSLQQGQGCCGRAFDLLYRQFLRSFVPTALLGELCTMLLARSTESTEEFVEQQNKFYLMYLLLGLLLGGIGWRCAQGISGCNHREREQLKRLVWRLFVVKLVWCTCRSFHWLLTCGNVCELMDKYNLLMILVERMAVLQILRMNKDFAEVFHQVRTSPNSPYKITDTQAALECSGLKRCATKMESAEDV